MTAIVLMAPVLSTPFIIDRLKVMLSFFLTLLIFPWVSSFVPALPQDLLMYGLIILKEVMVGVVIGFFLSILFSALSLSTQFYSTQIGLSMSQVFDPITQEETPILSYLFFAVALLSFIAIGGLHMVIRAGVDSYQLLPAVDFLSAKEAILEMSVRYFSLMFLVALKLSFPILASLLVIVVLLGLLGKAAPQMNIMILGLPIQYGMGLLALFLVLPHLIQMFGVLFENGVNDVMMLLMKLRAPA